jgi:hypothetical protein
VETKLEGNHNVKGERDMQHTTVLGG